MQVISQQNSQRTSWFPEKSRKLGTIKEKAFANKNGQLWHKENKLLWFTTFSSFYFRVLHAHKINCTPDAFFLPCATCLFSTALWWLILANSSRTDNFVLQHIIVIILYIHVLFFKALWACLDGKEWGSVLQKWRYFFKDNTNHFTNWSQLLPTSLFQ